MLVEAHSYKKEVIAKAVGDTLRFNAILFEYNKAPDITKKRLYIDAIEEILSNTSKIIVDVKQANNLLYLPLDKLMGDNKVLKSSGVEVKDDVNENQ